jgi:hypothetical protein
MGMEGPHLARATLLRPVSTAESMHPQSVPERISHEVSPLGVHVAELLAKGFLLQDKPVTLADVLRRDTHNGRGHGWSGQVQMGVSYRRCGDASSSHAISPR